MMISIHRVTRIEIKAPTQAFDPSTCWRTLKVYTTDSELPVEIDLFAKDLESLEIRASSDATPSF